MNTILQVERAENALTGDLVTYYSNLKTLSNKEICSLINNNHQRDLTLRQLRYIRKRLGLKRYDKVSFNDLMDIVNNELDTSNKHVGYRQMTEFINVKYNISVSKEKVRNIISIVDPDGVEERRRNAIRRRVYQTSGLNDVCHVDGNDKLKKWEFCIHGAVHGFS
eukprot:gene21326-23402_t